MWDSSIDASKRLKLIAEVTEAFKDVSLEGGMTLHQARALDDYAGKEAFRAGRAMDPEVHWQDVPEAKLREFHDVHAFLDPKGFRFYIPAFLVWQLRHLDDEDAGWGDSTYFSILQMHRTKLLSANQCKAICHVVLYIAEHNEYWGEDAKSAFMTYWKRFCVGDSEGAIDT